jgi:hypothetical protein
MNVEVVVTLISAGGVAVRSAAVSAYATARSIRLQHALTLRRAQLDRQEASEDLIRRYRAPLLLAAFEQQARICNVVQAGFFARHLASADPQEQQYARVSTLYRMGEYFGWTEILRRDLQFLDLGDDRRTRELAWHLAEVSYFQTPPSGTRLARSACSAISSARLERSCLSLRTGICGATNASAMPRSPRGWRQILRSPAGSSDSVTKPARSLTRLPDS